MKAITVRQPWASLIAAGVKTIETRPRSTSYRGRVAIHAGASTATWKDLDGPCLMSERTTMQAVLGAFDVFYDDGSWPTPWIDDDAIRIGWDVALPLGAVVASAVLTDCVPISRCQDPYEPEVPDFAVAVHWMGDRAWHVVGDTAADITDQLPYGDFTSGRWALLLDDIKPTTARCPQCWGAGSAPAFTRQVCHVCRGARACDPVPARGQQAVPWEWTP